MVLRTRLRRGGWFLVIDLSCLVLLVEHNGNSNEIKEHIQVLRRPMCRRGITEYYHPS
jgi:hypothetical protein